MIIIKIIEISKFPLKSLKYPKIIGPMVAIRYPTLCAIELRYTVVSLFFDFIAIIVSATPKIPPTGIENNKAENIKIYIFELSKHIKNANMLLKQTKHKSNVLLLEFAILLGIKYAENIAQN